jgi:hypothetical protein
MAVTVTYILERTIEVPIEEFNNCESSSDALDIAWKECEEDAFHADAVSNVEIQDWDEIDEIIKNNNASYEF